MSTQTPRSVHAGRQRELQYNPDRFLGQSIFSDVAEQRLRALLDDRAGLVTELQRRRSAGESAQEIGTQLQRLTEQLRETAGAARNRTAGTYGL